MTMTTQDIFNKSVLGVVKQGKRSIDWSVTHPTCAFRSGSSGELKCSLGQLMDDKYCEIDPELIMTSALSAINKSIGRALTDPETVMVFELLDAHDYGDYTEPDIDFLDRFKEDVAKVAKDHGLTMPEFET